MFKSLTPVYVYNSIDVMSSAALDINEQLQSTNPPAWVRNVYDSLIVISMTKPARFTLREIKTSGTGQDDARYLDLSIQPGGQPLSNMRGYELERGRVSSCDYPSTYKMHHN